MQNMTDRGANNMKIGIFGGAFNPVHNGHIQIMKSYLDYLELDKLILIPTADPPHKTGAFLVSEKDRLNMLMFLAEEDNRIEVSDMEFRREGKSYTYLTLLDLKKLYPDSKLYLIIGSDQYLAFNTWYKPDEILELATVCTMAREKSDLERLYKYREENENMKSSVIAEFEIFEASSTDIRNRLKEGKSIKGLVPEAVENYIREHGLYV